MSRFRLAQLARTDLAEIRHYISQDKPAATKRQISTFFDRFHTLAAHPEMGERRPELGADLLVLFRHEGLLHLVINTLTEPYLGLSS